MTVDPAEPDLFGHVATGEGAGAPPLSPAAPPGKPPRRRRSYAGLLAFVFTLGLVAWMGSGYYYPVEAPATQAPRDRARAPMAVEVIRSTAEPVTELVSAEGQVTPDRTTPVRAVVGGTVESIAVEKGTFVEAGTVIARIALADRAAQGTQARAELDRARGEFERLAGLAERGFTTISQVEAARAGLATAEAAVAATEQTTQDTEIRAPITGVLDTLTIDLNQVVSASDEVGTVVDIDPLAVEIQVPQQSIGRLRTGQPAEIRFVTGEARRGTVTYIASNASAATRTFAVEVSVPNPERDVPAGISARIAIPTGMREAHFLSAAILSLDTSGTLGVKGVDADDTVTFTPVELIRAETTGLWVAGLPEAMDVITVGQGFVSAGETVRPMRAEPGSGRSAPNPETQPSLPEGKSPAPIAEGWEAPATVDAGPARDEGGEVRVAEATPGNVRALQRQLAALGYDPGPVDGVLGAATRRAIRTFQRDKGLTETGEPDPSVARALLELPASSSTAAR